MSDDKDRAQDELRRLNFKVGEYRHYKGGTYLVASTSLMESTLEPLVHYHSVEKGTKWTRLLADFDGYVEVDGQRVKRFVFVRGFEYPRHANQS